MYQGGARARRLAPLMAARLTYPIKDSAGNVFAFESNLNSSDGSSHDTSAVLLVCLTFALELAIGKV